MVKAKKEKLGGSLIERLQRAGSGNITSTLASDSAFNVQADTVATTVPIINVAFSGKLNGGFVPGLTILAGESRTFKTLLSLLLLKSYLDKFSDGIGIIYDIERGITKEYLDMVGVDSDRVLLLRDIIHIEELKFDMVKRLEEIEKGDHVFFLVDSLGIIASNKEIEDAIEEKSVTDMTRAKSLRSYLRVVSPYFLSKEIPCVMINHVYQTLENYSKTVVGGGTAIMYIANQVLIVTRAQETEGEGKDKELLGYKFTLHIEKSRFVREKAKLAFTVLFDGGIDETSGLLEEAKEFGLIEGGGGGWYTYNGNKYRSSQFTKEFWKPILANEEFQTFVENKYKLSGNYDDKEDSSES